MEAKRREELQNILIATNNKKLVELANRIGNPIFQHLPEKVLVDRDLLSLLGRIIDRKSYKSFIFTRKSIQKLVDFFYRNGGWLVSREAVVNLDLEERAKGVFPEETKGKRLYYLYRDKDGFHVSKITNTDSDYIKEVRQIEEDFLTKRKEELDTLHKTFLVQESIIAGNYQAKRGFEKLAELILDYFDYKPRTPKVHV